MREKFILCPLLRLGYHGRGLYACVSCVCAAFDPNVQHDLSSSLASRTLCSTAWDYVRGRVRGLHQASAQVTGAALAELLRVSCIERLRGLAAGTLCLPNLSYLGDCRLLALGSAGRRSPPVAGAAGCVEGGWGSARWESAFMSTKWEGSPGRADRRGRCGVAGRPLVF